MNKDMTNDIMSDDEIRILGGGSQQNPEKKKGLRRFFGRKDKSKYAVIALLLLILAALIIFLCIFLIKKDTDVNVSNDINDAAKEVTSEKVVEETTVQEAFVLVKDTMVNDIPLEIVVPKGCQMELYMGSQPKDDNILVMTQAADIRSDMDAPTGAFVYKGEVIAKGHAKYGFCAIINGQVTLGRQLETALFERAIEENGNFFRQYSLVSAGQFMEIPPKGKAVRRALCLYNGEIQIVTTKDKESYHDFTQALVDLGFEEALALVGGDAIMQYKTPDGEIVKEGNSNTKHYKSENYLIWRK